MQGNRKKLCNMKVTVKVLEELEKNIIEDPSIDSTVKIGENTEKSLVDLRRLAVTQIPGKDPQLMLV